MVVWPYVERNWILPIAQQIIYQPEPIKCVEAVFIALFLTVSLSNIAIIYQLVRKPQAEVELKPNIQTLKIKK
jgi:hypothetical protein